MVPQIPETCTEHSISLPASEVPLGGSPPALDKAQEDGDHGKTVQRIQRAQWLRAAILGANDGLLSTALLVFGVGVATENHRSMLLSGVAGSVAGACSMAVGEYMSVATQRDIEMGCRKSNEVDPSKMIKEEFNLKVAIGAPERVSPKFPALSPGRSPMMKVIAEDETARGSEFEDNHDEETLPNPLKAAGASALSFMCGSIVPLLSTIFVKNDVARMVILGVVTSITLVLFGGVGAHLGGASIKKSAVRVLIGGWLAMAVTYGLLKLLDRDDFR